METQILVNTLPHDEDKLFVLTNDVKIGDKTYYFNMFDTHPEWKNNDWYILKNGEDRFKDFFYAQSETFENGKVIMIADHNLYKLIGELSPSAHWITNGQYLKESQIQLSEEYVKILCFNCKTFH